MANKSELTKALIEQVQDEIEEVTDNFLNKVDREHQDEIATGRTDEKWSELETAYNQVQEKASAMEAELKTKFLSYPIPKAIVEEWEKVK